MTLIEVSLLAGLAALAGAAALTLVLPFGRGTWVISAAATTLALAVIALAAVKVSRDGPLLAFGDWVYIDALGIVIASLVAAVGLLAVVNSLPYIEHEVQHGELDGRHARRYYALVLTFLATMFAVPLLNNLGAMWIAIEATTIVSALLVSIHRDRAGLEAAWKYLIIGSVGIAFALFGTMMTFYAAEPVLGDSGGALNWTTLRAAAGQLNPEVMRLAFVFVLVGYGTKAGLAPMHTWLPDAHSQAPSPVSGLLSGVLLKCALVALLRFGVLTDLAVGGGFRDNALMAFGLASIAVAVPFILVQGDVKRMLAYSSVENIGIIALAAGIGGPIATYAAVLHIVAHSLTKSSLFFSAGAVVQAYGTRRLHRLRGLARATPAITVAFVAATVGLSGFPPFATFVSEYGLISGAFSEGRGLVAVIGMGLVALAAAVLMLQVAGAAYAERKNKRTPGRVSRLALGTAVVPLLLAAWIAFAPPAPVRDMLRDAAAVMET
ncbi:MAG: hydrogenase 4 subunit F [Chloroflexi bacterium]|nr:hydrogenase 4 subunit F [Chloroflexota bacterium]